MKNIECLDWCKYDFEVNKHYWLQCGIKTADEIRLNNLEDLVSAITEEGIVYWVFGKTLLGLKEKGSLLNDHDDDVGIFEKDREAFEKYVLPRLGRKGFQLIRNNSEMLSVIRDGRYIDVCVFRKKGKNIGYGNKWVPAEYFNVFSTGTILNKSFKIPGDTNGVLSTFYGNKKYWKYLGKVIEKSSSKDTYLKVFKKLSKKAFRVSWTSLPILSKVFLKPTDFKISKYSLEEFSNLLIEPVDSFNWKWRKPHLDIVTNGKKYVKIGEIINYLKEEFENGNIFNSIKDTPTDIPFYDPHNYDRKFWNSGNNYFIYCVLFQFKKGVVPYSKANEYIKSEKKPYLYTKEYYESLPDMNDYDIQQMLQRHPIEITNGAITGGKHRAFAMIGRLVSGKTYLPFWVLENK